jgi:hypothetical protein
MGRVLNPDYFLTPVSYQEPAYAFVVHRVQGSNLAVFPLPGSRLLSSPNPGENKRPLGVRKRSKRTFFLRTELPLSLQASELSSDFALEENSR